MPRKAEPEVLEVDVGAPVAGGRCIARHDGRVLFVRGALPGERVNVHVTGTGRGGKFAWAQTIEVLQASADRVVPPCALAGRCGGCDWQHASLEAQRALKAQVVVDSLVRTGGLTEIDGVPIDELVTVEPLDDGDGLGWRTRMRFASTNDGFLGLREHNSHTVLRADGCPLEVTEIRSAISDSKGWPSPSKKADVVVVASSSGERAIEFVNDDGKIDKLKAPTSEIPTDVAIAGTRGRSWVSEEANGRSWRVAIDGFWQVHPRATETLTRTILDLLQPVAGESAMDLYSGVGVFAAAVAQAVGDGVVDAVEGDKSAVANARRNLHDMSQVRLHHASVESWLANESDRHVDLVVLDPPRSGVARGVVEQITSFTPSRVCYVACDPASLARDIALFRKHGYSVSKIAAFDLFPMTKHVECVALLTPSKVS